MSNIARQLEDRLNTPLLIQNKKKQKLTKNMNQRLQDYLKCCCDNFLDGREISIPQKLCLMTH